MENSIFARFARAFFIFWHFEDFLVLSTTWNDLFCSCAVSYTHLRAHETRSNLVCRLLLEKFVLTTLESNWNQRLGHERTKLNICHHMLTSSTQLPKQVISSRGKDEKVFKMSKDEKCTCKACKITVFHCQICKFVGFLLPSSSWLLKLPTVSLAPLQKTKH